MKYYFLLITLIFFVLVCSETTQGVKDNKKEDAENISKDFDYYLKMFEEAQKMKRTFRIVYDRIINKIAMIMRGDNARDMNIDKEDDDVETSSMPHRPSCICDTKEDCKEKCEKH